MKQPQLARQANETKAQSGTSGDGKVGHGGKIFVVDDGKFVERGWATGAWLATTQERVPKRQDDEVLAQLLLCGLTNLANALL